MTVAIKRAKGDIIWFDAVLQFNRQNSASVSKHPLETGSYITDHTTTENPIISLNGLITDVDFNLQRPQVAGLNQKQFVNNVPLNGSTVDVQADGGKYSKYLPESVSQFLEDDAPSVTVTPITRSKLTDSLEEDLIQIWKEKEAITLVEFSGNKIKKTYTNCIVTNLTFNESGDSGDALWPNMTFEQVAFAKSSNVKIPQNVSAKVKNAAAPTNGKGSQATAPSPTGAPAAGEVNFSKAVAADISQAAKLKDSTGFNLFGGAQ